MTEEALDYADAVVVGEAEGLWPQVLADFERGRLQRVYRLCTPPDITDLAPARRELLSDKYFVHTVQTGRGCPINGHFCSVTAFNGPRYRLRDLDRVMAEIESIPGRQLFIVDDNIVGSGRKYMRRAKEFFERMKGCGKEWGAQTCLNIVEHDDVLRAAADSGCRTLLIDFERSTPTPWAPCTSL